MRLVIALAALFLIAECFGAYAVYQRQVGRDRELVNLGYHWPTPPPPPPPAEWRRLLPRHAPGIDQPAKMIAAEGLNHRYRPDQRWDDMIWLNEDDVRAEKARRLQACRDDMARWEAMQRAGDGAGDRR